MHNPGGRTTADPSTGVFSGSQAGLGVIEMAIASALLAVVSVLMVAILTSVQGTSEETAVRLNMDETGRRVLNLVRRELRQSGDDGAGLDRVTAPADGETGTSLTFQMRNGPDDDDWSTPITYRRIDDGVFPDIPGNISRYKVERVQDGTAVTVAEGVSVVTFERPAGGTTVVVTLELMRARPTAESDGRLADPIVRLYTDTIQVQNRPSD